MDGKHLLVLRRFTQVLAAAPWGERWLRLARRVLPRSSERILVEDFDGDLAITLDLNEHMQSVIFWGGIYSRDLARLLNRLLRPGMTFVDVGANVGEITLLAAKRVGPAGRVVAFEPIQEIADRLSRNVAANGFEQISIRQVALCDREGLADIYRSAGIIKDGSVNDGLGSLYIGDRDRKAAGSITVSTLDSQIAVLGLIKIDVIKMDIEGAELPALRGAEKVLRDHRPILIVEVQEETANAAGYQAADLFKFLSVRGYHFETILNNGITKPLDPSQLRRFQNVLCRPSGEA